MVTLMAMCQSLLNLAISHQAHHHIPQFLASDKIGLMRSDNDELIRNIGCFFFIQHSKTHVSRSNSWQPCYTKCEFSKYSMHSESVNPYDTFQVQAIYKMFI